MEAKHEEDNERAWRQVIIYPRLAKFLPSIVFVGLLEIRIHMKGSKGGRSTTKAHGENNIIWS